MALRSMGGSNVQYLVPNRFEDGYGLSLLVAPSASKSPTTIMRRPSSSA
jgi:single-stranded-DNA-specific exonuclease